MTSDRRSFLKRAALSAATAAAAALPAGAHDLGAQQGSSATAQRAATPRPPARALEPALLAAVGEAVLPEMLGAEGRARAVAAFAQWLARYEPVTEQMHGYGDAEITYTPSDPAPGWNAQLAGLDLLARRKHRRGFARLGVPLRRAVLRAQLASLPGARIPSSPLVAPHVAIALLSHWTASSEALDLAYQARIASGHCRGLAGVSRPPLPLATEARS